MKLSVVIPSKTMSNLVPCIRALRKHEPEARIIIVDDGLDCARHPVEVKNLYIDSGEVQFIEGQKPFSFPCNVNLGLRAAGNDDCVILNDDALLETPGGFSLLQEVSEKNPDLGLVSSTTNVAGNPLQYPRGVGLRCVDSNIAFVCVLVPRRTIETVGFMDEQFGGLTPDGKIIYGSCDSDLCRRVRNAGLKIAVHDDCFVDHGSLRSSFRGDPRAAGDCSAGRELYLQKWGDLN